MAKKKNIPVKKEKTFIPDAEQEETTQEEAPKQKSAKAYKRKSNLRERDRSRAIR